MELHCWQRRMVGGLLAALGLGFAASAQTVTTNVVDNIGHDRHRHHYGSKLPTEPASPSRFVTSRSSNVMLPLPQEKDAFTFAVFGDRTGGPVEGVSVLADAVRDVNLIEPDLVMTVGDLVNGYNARAAWLEQATEFKSIMEELRCPWFPVAGNHDVYWRGPDRPADEHDGNYEMHFGPLWYAFSHKRCWFIVLYSDESHPVTGEKNFSKPENHVMSEAQFGWLKETLVKARGAEHVFVFLHHPRWTGGSYGDSWDRVHRELVAAGNVTAVFAGHIHRMRYDPKDGIEYVTLATVGGGQSETVPSAGWAHEFHLVTVRKDRIALSAIPVGEVMDVREITGDFAAQCAAQAQSRFAFDGTIAFGSDGAVKRKVQVSYTNLTTHPVELTVTPDSDDARWLFGPDHDHGRLAPGEVWSGAFEVVRPSGAFDAGLRMPVVMLEAHVVGGGRRYVLPERTIEFPVDYQTIPMPPVPAREQVLALDGKSAVLLDPAEVALPQGAFTLETWFRADEYGDRTGLVGKMEMSEYGIFVTGGVPQFSVFLGDAYVVVKSDKPVPVGRWSHVAGVFDGEEVRLYVDGEQVGRKPGTGSRKLNKLPLVLGADVTSAGDATSHFRGQLDATRLTRGAVYTGERFSPARRLTAVPGATVFLSNYDATLGRKLWDEAGRRGVGRYAGKPILVMP